MTPPPPHLCEGCALQESRDGRVCPAASDAYGLPDVAAERHAAALHAAIVADAGRIPSFAELVRRDAIGRRARVLSVPNPSRPVLCPSSSPTTHDSAKEVVHVFPSRTN